MKLVLFLDCYGVLYVRPLDFIIESHPRKREELVDVYKSFNFGLISEGDFIRQVAQITKLTEESLNKLFSEHLVINQPLIDGVKARLSDMYKVYILSNTTQSDLDHLCSRDEVRSLPSLGSISSELLGAMKPSQESFSRALNKVSTSASEAVLVDDLLENINGAEAVGMGGVHYINVENTISSLEGLYNARVA